MESEDGSLDYAQDIEMLVRKKRHRNVGEHKDIENDFYSDDCQNNDLEIEYILERLLEMV